MIIFFLNLIIFVFYLLDFNMLDESSFFGLRNNCSEKEMRFMLLSCREFREIVFCIVLFVDNFFILILSTKLQLIIQDYLFCDKDSNLYFFYLFHLNVLITI